MRSREVIAALTRDGWKEVAQKGSHVQFKHPTKPGRVTVPHPERDVPICGLPAPSVVRPIKIACIEPAHIDRRIGRLDKVAAR
jgi:predicted RNA binding protein YcfA (HicA-like mRNA interferase family)